MRQVNGRMILEPQITGFGVAILMGIVERNIAVLREEAKVSKDGVASIVASMVEYDQILAALKAEHDLWQDYRTRVKPKS